MGAGPVHAGGNPSLTHRGKRRQAGRTPHGARPAHPGSGGNAGKRPLNETGLERTSRCLPRRPGRTGTPERTRCRSWRSWRSHRSTAGPRHSPSDWPAGKSPRSGKRRAGSGVLTPSPPSSPKTRSSAEPAPARSPRPAEVPVSAPDKDARTRGSTRPCRDGALGLPWWQKSCQPHKTGTVAPPGGGTQRCREADSPPCDKAEIQTQLS